MHCIQLLQVPLCGPSDSIQPFWTTLLTSLRGVNGVAKVLWAPQHEDQNIRGLAISWKSYDAQKDWAASAASTTLMGDIKSIATGPLYEDILLFSEAADGTLSANAVEIVSRIHPTSQIDKDKMEKVEYGFSKFQEAISNEAPQAEGGLVAGWGQVEFDHEGVPSRRFTAFIGWKSVQAHYDCKSTPPFKKNIHWLMENGHTGTEMVHYAFSQTAEE